MKTCTLKSVYESILRMRGYDPATAAVGVGEQGRIIEWLNERMLDAWERCFWPEVMLVEQRQYRADWDDELLYSTGDEVWLDPWYYVSLQDGNVGQNPETETTFWERTEAALQKTIEFRQAGETEIGSVDLGACVYAMDPRLHQFAGLVEAVICTPDGIQVLATPAPARPFIRFRPPSPEFTLTGWDSLADYAIGDLVYLASTGLCYRALKVGTGRAPDQQTDYWVEVQLPWMFKKYLVHAVHADSLLNPEERGKELSIAESALDELEDRMIDGRGNVRKVSFRRN